MDEQRLEHLARNLGRRAAARVDPDTTASAVVRRLRAAPARRVWWRMPVLQAAAVIVLLAGGGLLLARGGLWRGVNGEMALPLPAELSGLESDELVEVLDSLQIEAPIVELLPVSLADLDEGQLEELLQAMEG